MSTLKISLTLIVILFLSTSTQSQVLYSSTEATSRFNPGLGLQGTPVIAYDDVDFPVPTEEGDSISINKINVGIRRMPNAPATNVNIYYTSILEDTTGQNSTDKPVSIFLGSVSLPANGTSFITSVISLGDSVTALIRIKKNASAEKTGNQKFLIGASFDNPSTANGIILTKETQRNTNSIWIDNTGQGTLFATNLNSRIPATYYLEVFGNGVNKPTGQRNANEAVAVNTIKVTNFLK